jgi:hypothetical protein
MRGSDDPLVIVSIEVQTVGAKLTQALISYQQIG